LANERGFRGDKSYQRRGKPIRQPRLRILIVCEGAKTEPIYFKELRSAKRIPAEVEICGEECGSHPKNVVEYALAKKKLAISDKLPYDQIWCVYDRDVHVNIDQARMQAKANNIQEAFSVPCFELWFLLHFKCHTAHIERDKVVSELKKHLPGYEKGMKVFGILPVCAIALHNAERIRRNHLSAGMSTDSNPSTTVDRLVAVLNEIAKMNTG